MLLQHLPHARDHDDVHADGQFHAGILPVREPNAARR
jgi:hypothetical protein